jgi:hypothetical protein
MVLQRLRLLGMLTSVKYASLMGFSSICTFGLLLWAVRAFVVDLSLYSLSSPTRIVGRVCNTMLVILLLGHI